MTESQVRAAQVAYSSYMRATDDPRWPELKRLHEAVAVRKAVEAAERVGSPRE